LTRKLVGQELINTDLLKYHHFTHPFIAHSGTPLTEPNQQYGRQKVLLFGPSRWYFDDVANGLEHQHVDVKRSLLGGGRSLGLKLQSLVVISRCVKGVNK